MNAYKHTIVERTLSRRRWLELAATSIAGSILGGCAVGSTQLATRSGYRRPLSPRPFASPQIGDDRVMRTRVGLRPFRRGGFVVRGERFDNKFVIHNYGHGGGGITLSWGSSELAVRELPDIADRRAAVIGCGVMGLSTARLLQARGWQVTIYAKDLPPNTTSDVAGGVWAPTSVFRPGEGTAAFAAQFVEALKLSHAEFSSHVGPLYGVSWRESYHLSQFPVRARDYYYLDRWPEFFPAIAELSADDHPFPVPYVMRHLSLLIEPAIYLPRLMQEVREAGGSIRSHALHNVSELQAFAEPVIFNCTGLGSRELFDDVELVPVRGQLVFMPPDERIDYITHGSGQGLLYMFPRADGILLGGTYEREATHLEPDIATTDRIVREHVRMFSALRL